MLVSVALLVATVVLFARIPKGFIPNEDQGYLFLVTEAQEGVSFDQMRDLQLAVAETVRRNRT